MNENWFWKCPKCGKINSVRETYEDEPLNELIDTCENADCRYEVKVYVSYTQPEFEFVTINGDEDIESFDEFDLMMLDEDEQEEDE